MTDHIASAVDPDAARTIGQLLHSNQHDATTQFPGFRQIAPTLLALTEIPQVCSSKFLTCVAGST